MDFRSGMMLRACNQLGMHESDADSCYIGMKCTDTTSLGTFKWRLDEHHPALLWHFASLVLIYKTLDLLT